MFALRRVPHHSFESADMCLLILALDAVSDAPLFVAANRDEAVRRPSLPPEKVEGDEERSAYIAPMDVQAGGTWIGINTRRTFVAVTNRPRRDIPPQSTIERGALSIAAGGRRRRNNHSSRMGRTLARTLYRLQSGCRVTERLRDH